MFKEALILGSLAIGGADNNAAVSPYPNVPAHVEYLNSESSFDVSQFDPSEFPYSGKVFMGLVFLTLLATAYNKYKEALKLKSDPDVRQSGKFVAGGITLLALYGLAETFTDLPW